MIGKTIVRALRAPGPALAVVLLLTVGGAAPARAVAQPPRITFYFGLKRPEAQARAAFFAVQQPGSPS